MSSRVIKLMPDIIVGFSPGSVIIEGHDVNNCLRVPLLISPRDSIFPQHPLPFCGKALYDVSLNSTLRMSLHNKQHFMMMARHSLEGRNDKKQAFAAIIYQKPHQRTVNWPVSLSKPT